MSQAGLASKVVKAASNGMRQLGAALDKMGASMEVAKFTEKLVPSTRFVAVNGVEPTVSKFATFVAPSASLVGDVSIGPNSSIWYGATVRGDVNKITIGENSSIGDRAVIHVAKIQGDFNTSIGNDVTVGPGAMVHAAVVGDSCLVGPSAQILDGSVVGANSIVAAGAVVTPGTKIGEGQLWAGSPAKMVRKLTDEEIASIADTAKDTNVLAMEHAMECNKDYEQYVADIQNWEDMEERDPDYFQPSDESDTDVLGQGAPGRIFDSTLSEPEEGIKAKKSL
mmetsp:Transcript_35497/g.54568  ORF Transcript_35497/g.54568 Transcript_35497/m.54568 type:complete len:281 (-) Transcript_35497:77-919(-)|eukprot:CAMPEP_0118698088 /NCGR_PEP_ID=MMETSP0800-20121206/14971_1 /TAXON_ID=210618 ORGANISM="Striatella unipunctata, Strain CCMP2910" /NCGR_SAMPLE_ID=MMETSP0800 /ASSEMBLY_ACC=CAM_ASM_000638 /LENGTH=280 /DNA_ID=CAMNT_0006597799 /DNA_START=95 /DNA_END=937 /DNA_ORIENTATION=+